MKRGSAAGNCAEFGQKLTGHAAMAAPSTALAHSGVAARSAAVVGQARRPAWMSATRRGSGTGACTGLCRARCSGLRRWGQLSSNPVLRSVSRSAVRNAATASSSELYA